MPGLVAQLAASDVRQQVAGLPGVPDCGALLARGVRTALWLWRLWPLLVDEAKAWQRWACLLDVWAAGLLLQLCTACCLMLRTTCCVQGSHKSLASLFFVHHGVHVMTVKPCIIGAVVLHSLHICPASAPKAAFKEQYCSTAEHVEMMRAKHVLGLYMAAYTCSRGTGHDVDSTLSRFMHAECALVLCALCRSSGLMAEMVVRVLESEQRAAACGGAGAQASAAAGVRLAGAAPPP